MPHHFANIAFTPTVTRLQEEQGSRASYARMQAADGPVNLYLSEVEAEFIAARDSVYMATVTETGWPYIQHRGGPMGFLRVLDDRTLGFADFRGNRQYISLGNLSTDDRVSLFLMDYPNRRRLKILGRARAVGLEDTPTLARLDLPDYRARIERGFLITVEGFDWNCPQHITPRFSMEQIDGVTAPLLSRIATLEAALGL
jgi:predicted pyridoxine 5'-phosphate oxidase superfamily flavin-nucleotide-binding protein